jgi:hypothetical protein
VNRGKPQHCADCGASGPGRRYEWANLTGRYGDSSDYKRLCRQCHIRFDNIGASISRAQTMPVHCGNGHLWSENTWIRPSTGKRQCRACLRERCRERRARQLAAKTAP